LRFLNISTETTPETQQRQDSPEDKVFEQLLASKIRVDIKEKKERAAKEREMLTSFLLTRRKVGGLYVLETIEWHRSWGFSMYVLHFGFVCEWWVARDLAYPMIIA